uniref:Uncharacterized protein n=1 Tax=Meloidogyne incognita TaxID=6306 RepID=A0A914NKF1_MELIC
MMQPVTYGNGINNDENESDGSQSENGSVLFEINLDNVNTEQHYENHDGPIQDLDYTLTPDQLIAHQLEKTQKEEQNRKDRLEKETKKFNKKYARVNNECCNLCNIL